MTLQNFFGDLALAAKQPALGTAGTPSADVISVQGIASMTPVKVDRADASNFYGTAVSVVASASADVVTHVAGVGGYKIQGLSVIGNGDAQFWIKINGTAVLSTRINTINMSQFIALPNPIVCTAGQTIKIVVTNQSADVCDYEATLLGES